MGEMEKLDEKGFIFIDREYNPFLCRLWGNEAWLFKWHDGHWVSLQKLTQGQVWRLPKNLDPDEQEYYRKKTSTMGSPKGGR